MVIRVKHSEALSRNVVYLTLRKRWKKHENANIKIRKACNINLRNQIFCSGGELQYRGKLCEIVYGQRTFTIEYYRNLIVLVISNVLSVRRFPPRWPGQCLSLSVSPSVTLCPDCVCSVARQSRASQLRRFQSSMGSLISRTHTVSTLGPGGQCLKDYYRSQ